MAIVTRHEPAQAARSTDSVGRNNSTTVADDLDLSIPVQADTVYKLRIHTRWTNAGLGDFKWGLNGPAGTLAFNETLGASGQDISGGTALDDSGADNGYEETSWMIVTGNTSGNLTFQWAQRVSDAGLTILKRGSHITLEKVVD